MISSLKQKLCAIILGLLVITGSAFCLPDRVDAAALQFERDFTSQLKDYVISPSDHGVNTKDTFKENILHLFYPQSYGTKIYNIIK